MIYGYRITKIRELLHLSKEQLARSVCVSVATINNWENGKSNPKRLNLELLASALHTTMDYLEGLTDNPSCVKYSDETVQKSSAVNVCEICGKPIPERLRKCIPCRWKTRWPESLLNSSRLETRRKRSHTTQILSLDREKPEAVFCASTDKNRTTYFTTLETCTCRDFEITHGEIPCKHILRLAGELGLFQSEYFAKNEDDYTFHVAAESPTVNPDPVKYPSTAVPDQVPEKIPHTPRIFAKLLRYAVCCFFGFWAVAFMLLAFQDKTALCFPVGFAVAGTITAMTANRKGEKSAFKWWLYGALVPVVSWIDAVMLNSENRVKAFIKGVAYSFAGIVIFLIVLVQFIPSAR